MLNWYLNTLASSLFFDVGACLDMVAALMHASQAVMERDCASCKLLLCITFAIPLPPFDYRPMQLHEVSQTWFAAFISFLGVETGCERCPFPVGKLLSVAPWATTPVT